MQSPTFSQLDCTVKLKITAVTSGTLEALKFYWNLAFVFLSVFVFCLVVVVVVVFFFGGGRGVLVIQQTKRHLGTLRCKCTVHVVTFLASEMLGFQFLYP